MLKTKLSFEQQESKFKQERLARQLKDAKEQLQLKQTREEQQPTASPDITAQL